MFGVCLVALALTALLLLIAGANKNAQVTSLREHGVPVEVKVTGCLGLLGGSGSNAAGYACTGTYVYSGHHFEQSIPGNALLRPGQIVRGVVVPSDPTLLSTPQAVASQKASWRVFIAPVILLLIVLVLIGVAVVIGRRGRTDRPAAAD